MGSAGLVSAITAENTVIRDIRNGSVADIFITPPPKLPKIEFRLGRAPSYIVDAMTGSDRRDNYALLFVPVVSRFMAAASFGVRQHSAFPYSTALAAF